MADEDKTMDPALSSKLSGNVTENMEGTVHACHLDATLQCLRRIVAWSYAPFTCFKSKGVGSKRLYSGKKLNKVTLMRKPIRYMKRKPPVIYISDDEAEGLKGNERNQKRKLDVSNVTTPVGNSFIKSEHERYYGSKIHKDKVIRSQNGDLTATIEDFQSLSPDRCITTEIVEIVAFKITYVQRQLKEQTLWCLPPSFSRDLQRGNNIDYFKEKYVPQWMPPSANLKYIYVPVEDIAGRWYLMVVSIGDQMVYHLDIFLDKNLQIVRRRIMEHLCEMLSQLMGSRSYPDNLFKDVLDLFTWEVMEATGLPHIPWGERSAVWVVDWMYMVDSFQPNLSPSMNEKVLRMRVAMDLLCGDHNECWNNLKAKTESFWRSVRHKKIQ
ncbi:Papain-like cysteine peptidase superfamily [Sesbania bispinosa]|nr:Papain-like cysteine peptidase superfamily [Sesbania bispinosa]